MLCTFYLNLITWVLDLFQSGAYLQLQVGTPLNYVNRQCNEYMSAVIDDSSILHWSRRQ